MLKIEEDKVKIKKLLGQLNKGSTGKAYVAGGWVRDYLLGRTPKDIDIFIETLPTNFLGVFFEGSPMPPSDIDKRLSGIDNPFILSETYVEGCSLRDDVSCLVKYDSYGLDVISMKTPLKAFMANFDMSICCAYGDYDEKTDEVSLYASEDFIQFTKDKTIYQYSCVDQRQDHVDRLKAKFPEAKWEMKEFPSSEYTLLGKF